MLLKDMTIGFGITGSFCTHSLIMPVLKNIVCEGACVIPIITPSVDKTDTRFGSAEDLKNKIEAITGNKILKTIVEVEPIGPKSLIDIMLVAPCTGNSIAKIANGISDTSVTMACKAQLRNNKPVVIFVSTNDGLSGNAKNISTLINRKNVYVVPFKQDAPDRKPDSVVSKTELIIPTLLEAVNGRQLQPVLYND